METEINASSERRINKPRIGRYLADLKIWNLRMQKNLNIEKVSECIHSQKYIFDIFTVVNLQNNFTEHDLYLIFGIKTHS